MQTSEPSGVVYIVIKEEKNVNELGNSVPKLVPYDYSSDEDSKQNSQDDVNSNNGDSMSVSSDEKSNDEGSCGTTSEVPMPEDGAPDSPFPVSADDFELYFKDSWGDDYSNEDYRPRSPEAYAILTDRESCDNSVFIDMLKQNGCSESGFCFSGGTPGMFCAYLHKEELKKMKGDPRIVQITRADNIVCDTDSI